MSISENLKKITAALAVIGSVTGGAALIDDRYALAKDVEANKAEIRSVATEIRVQTLSDKIFELKIKGDENLNNVEKAMLHRYQNELDYLKK
ncbi:MAG: hypothetical protein IBX57_00790 [Gammaproteobacteria bacterium]|nr:hypothetical protein [Gammaproteobacteria bacterium]